jgi:hypothetical protein
MSTVAMDPRLSARRIEVMRRQGRRRLRFAFYALAIGAAAFAIFGLTRSPLLDVDTISVKGVERTPEGLIAEIASELKSQPLLELDTRAVEEAIVALPWVDHVSSDRSLDGTLTFVVTERPVVAAVAGESGWLLVDANGRVLEQVVAVPPGVVAVDGLAWDLVAGEWVPDVGLPGIEVAAAMPPGLAAAVSSVRLGGTPEVGIELVLKVGGIVVLGPNLDLDQKFVSAATILQQVPLRCLEMIDVRAPTVPVLTRDPGCL